MEEISLRELIEIIIKGKWIIVAVTAVCIAIGIAVNAFVIKPVYVAQTTLMISSIKKSQIKEQVKSGDGDVNNFSSLIDDILQYPEMSVDNYREQVKNPVILEYIREEMDMKDVPLSSIASKITLNEIKDTDLITIKVTDENPETAAKIANLVGDRLDRKSVV